MKPGSRKKTFAAFAVTLIVIAAIFALSMIDTNAFNRAKHHTVFSGPALFSAEQEATEPVSVKAIPRSSTWTKVFDLNGEGLTEHNYQAYTYDFTISNNTRDEVDEFTFLLQVNRQVYLLSGWNGETEVHQVRSGGEIVATIPDLREYAPEAYPLEYVTVDGESMVSLEAGDYFRYIPSSSMNAMEVPIEPEEGTTPGFILYVAIGDSIEDSTLSLDYSFHRLLTSVPMFWISLAGLAV